MDWNGLGPPQSLSNYKLNPIPTKNILVIDMWWLNFRHHLNKILTIETWQLNFGHHLYGQGFFYFYIFIFLQLQFGYMSTLIAIQWWPKFGKKKSWSLRCGDGILVDILIVKVIEFFLKSWLSRWWLPHFGNLDLFFFGDQILVATSSKTQV
jgi:hypothetical protein